MSFTSRLTFSLGLVAQSFKLLFTRPWLMLYGMVPAIIVELLARQLNYLNFLTAILLVKTIVIFYSIAFIYHVSTIIEHKKIDFKELLSKPIIFSFVVFIVFNAAITMLQSKLPFLDEYAGAGVLFLFSLIGLSIQILINVLIFLLAITVSQKTSIVNSAAIFIQMCRNNFLEILVGVLVVGFVLGMLQFILTLVIHFFTQAPGLQTFILKPLFIGLSLVRYVFAVLFTHWYMGKR